MVDISCPTIAFLRVLRPTEPYLLHRLRPVVGVEGANIAKEWFPVVLGEVCGASGRPHQSRSYPHHRQSSPTSPASAIRRLSPSRLSICRRNRESKLLTCAVPHCTRRNDRHYCVSFQRPTRKKRQEHIPGTLPSDLSSSSQHLIDIWNSKSSSLSKTTVY